MKPYYSEYEIDILVSDTGEVCDEPYSLFAAYAISCLYDLVEDNSVWGTELPQTIVDRTLKSAIMDFCAAADSCLPVNVFGRNYRIGRVNAFDRKALINQFDFQQIWDNYLIEKSRIVNLSVCLEKPYLKTRNELRDNRTFFRKVVMVAEDEEHDGWDKLTDMEVAVYCWGLFYYTQKNNNVVEWYSEFKEYIGQPSIEVQKCLNDECKINNRPNGMFPFSANAVREWNINHNQVSVVDNVNEEEANDYWYNIAIKKRFKQK